MEFHTPLVILVSCTLIFHLIFIKIFPQDKRFWKKVDYFWVALGTLGVVGATFSLRKEYATASTPFHQSGLELTFTRYLNELDFEHRYYSDPNGFDYSAFKDQVAAKQYILAGSFFDSLHNEALSYKDNIVDKHEFELMDTLIKKQNEFLRNVTNSYIAEEANSKMFLITDVQGEIRELKLREKQSSRNEYNWILLFISPYVFAIAIAIRLTKVTAELREIK